MEVEDRKFNKIDAQRCATYGKIHFLMYFLMQRFHLVFSSPEPKAHVSFSDQNLSVVRRRCRRRRRRCRCRKLFTFSSSSQEPLGQFQQNLAQSILGWRGFKFVQMKGHTISQGEIIAKILKLY